MIGIQNPQSGIHNKALLDYLTCADGLKWGDQIVIIIFYVHRELACSEINVLFHGYYHICLDPLLRSAITKLTRFKMTFWKRSCLPFTKSFRKIRLVKWNTTFWVGSFRWQISESNETSEKVVLMFQTEIRVPCFQSHFWHCHLHAFAVVFRKMKLISTNGKHDSGTKLTSPEFCVPFAQTVDRPVCSCKW